MPQFVDQSLTVDMIRYYAEQAAMHSSRNPGNQDAAMTAIQWQQRLMAAVQAGGSMPGQAGPMPAPGVPVTGVPSALPGAPAPVAQAPTPPLATGGPVSVPRSWEFNHGSQERGHTGHFSSFHTPVGHQSRAATPRPPASPRSRVQRDLSARRRGNRSRTPDPDAGLEADETGLGTRVLQTWATLRKHAQDMASQIEVVQQAQTATDALHQRLAHQESIIENVCQGET